MVEIEIHLRDNGAEERILAIKSALTTLDETASDVDVGSAIDSDEITGHISEVIRELKDLETNVDRIERKLNNFNIDVDNPEAEFTKKVKRVDETTGSGDSVGGDPPDKGGGGDSDGPKRNLPTPEQIQGRWDFGDAFEDTDIEILSNFDADALDELNADLGHSVRDLTFDGSPAQEGVTGYDWVTEEGAENLGADSLTNLHTTKAPEDMEWNELQERASFFNAYPQNADRGQLEDAVKRHQLSGDGIGIKTDSHGTVGPRTAERVANQDLTPDFDDDFKQSFRQVKQLAEQQRQLLKESGLDPQALVMKKRLDLKRMDDEKRDELFDFAGIDEDERFGELGNKKTKMSQFTEEQQKRLREQAKFEFDDLVAEDDGGFFGDAGLNREKRVAAPESDIEFGPDSSDPRLDWTSDFGRDDDDSIPNFDVPTFGGGPLGDGRSRTDLIEDSRILSRIDEMRTFGDVMDALGDSNDRLGKKLRKLKPSMSTINNAIASVLPVAIALGTALLGVASAMAAVAGSAALIGGLGLLGHGDTMAESFDNAKQRIQELKEEMFQAAQPMMQQFAPIQDRMFDSIPGALDDVFESMEGLTAFEDTFFRLGRMLADGMEKAVDAIVANEEGISQLVIRFSELAGSAVFDFFSFLYKEAKRNQGLLASMGGDIKKLIKVIYNLSVALTRILTAFSPLYNILLFVSKLLKNDLIMLLAQMIGWLFVIGKAASTLWALYAGFIAVFEGAQMAIAGITGYTISVWQAVAAMAALATLMSIVTLGTAAVLGGAAMAGAGSGMGGADAGMGGPGGEYAGKTVINDNREYNFQQTSGNNYADKKAMEDTVRSVNEGNDASERPTVDNSGRTTDER